MGVSLSPTPFSLSLSKACPSAHSGVREGVGFDRLSPNGFRNVEIAR